MRGSKVLFAAACAGTLSAGLPSGIAAAATPAKGWTIQATPNPSGSIASLLKSVSCSTASACTAVGYWNMANQSLLGLAERWNGSAWSIQPTPTPAGFAQILLSGVSCPGPSLCLAVGAGFTAQNVFLGVAEKWDGSNWTAVPVPVPPHAAWMQLSAVSCASVTACTAVGSYFVGNQQEQPLAESWNGTAWTLEAVPNPFAENGAGATTVSCTTPTTCMAGVEFAYADVDQAIYALRWDGSQWTRLQQRNPGGQSFNSEASVSCTSAAACTAVGSWTDNGALTLAERWDGTTWRRELIHGPAGSAQSALAGVSCTAGVCIAVGTSSRTLNGRPTTTLAELWDGVHWVVVTTPNPTGAMFSNLAGVACTSPTACIAVGDSYNSTTKTDTTLAESFSG